MPRRKSRVIVIVVELTIDEVERAGRKEWVEFRDSRLKTIKLFGYDVEDGSEILTQRWRRPFSGVLGQERCRTAKENTLNVTVIRMEGTKSTEVHQRYPFRLTGRRATLFLNCVLLRNLTTENFRWTNTASTASKHTKKRRLWCGG